MFAFWKPPLTSIWIYPFPQSYFWTFAVARCGEISFTTESWQGITAYKEKVHGTTADSDTVHTSKYFLDESSYCVSMSNSCCCQRDGPSKQAQEMLVGYFCCLALAGCPEPLTSIAQLSHPRASHPQSGACVFCPLLGRNSSSNLVSRRNLLAHFLPSHHGGDQHGLLLLYLSQLGVV